MSKGGRPRHELDYTLLDKLCAIQCTGEEVASVMGIDYDTLNRALKRDGNAGFAEYFKKKGAHGRTSLRRKQMESALSGNTSMMIWLGKQYLGQRDKQETELSGPDGGAIKTDNKFTVEIVSADT